MAIAVVVPSRFAGSRRPVEMYARRRLMVLFVLAAIVLVLLVSTGHVVANRGGAPASTPAVRPANGSSVYVVQAGDTLWSIGERFHGGTPLADYVDSLVAANGGTQIQLSQALTLP